jgi:hypothetical protein
MPRPNSYQWLFNGAAIPGANQSSLVVSNVNLASLGSYSVRVSNGLRTTVSTEARLDLDTTASAPVIVSLPQNATRAPGRTARFTVSVCAEPTPTFQWFTNGVPASAESMDTLFIPDCALEMSGMEVRVRVSNDLGSAEAAAQLYVSTEMELRFTELQANPKAGCEGHRDWIELTNFGTNEWQLMGYRLGDTTHLADAFTITLPVTIHPRESVIFFRDASIGGFFEWWGARQLPRDLQVIPFTGFSLKKGGEPIFLWDDNAERDDEYITSAAFPNNTAGVSVRLEQDGRTAESALGAFGAFRAVECGDIGSPGWAFLNPPLSLLEVLREENRFKISWGAEAGATYRIETKLSLGTGQWTTLAERIASSWLESFEDTRNLNRECYYRVLKLSP